MNLLQFSKIRFIFIYISKQQLRSHASCVINILYMDKKNNFCFLKIFLWKKKTSFLGVIVFANKMYSWKSFFKHKTKREKCKNAKANEWEKNVWNATRNTSKNKIKKSNLNLKKKLAFLFCCANIIK